MLRRLLSNTILLSASLALALLIGEGVARFYLRYQDARIQEANRANILTQVNKMDLFVPAEPGSFANRPNASLRWWGQTIRTDSLGCRVEPAAPDDARVILFLGDSMIFGLGLPDSSTIPALLQQDLNGRQPGNPTRVVNSGVIGYDFQQYLYQLQRLAPEVRPDLVLVGICYNDLLPNEDPFGNVMADRMTGPQDHMALAQDHGCSCERPENLTQEAKAFTSGTDCSCQTKTGSGRKLICYESSMVCTCKSLVHKARMIIKSSALYQVWRQSGLHLRPKKEPARVYNQAAAASLSRAPGLVTEFIRTAREMGIPLAFVYFPQYEALGQPSPVVYVNLLRQAGEPVLDLSFSTGLSRESYFLRAAEGHLQPDLHFNLKGSRVVAGEISRWLVESGLWTDHKLNGKTGEISGRL